MATFTPTTELLLNGTWTNITSDVRLASGISITRGRADEASTADPSTCSLTLNNRAGNYSPRNPVGVHYGVLGRNTQMRVRTPSTLANHMILSGGDPLTVGGWSSYASTPDHTSLRPVGDLDVRVEVEPRAWRPKENYGLAQRYLTSGQVFSRSWAFWLTSTGHLSFRWSTDGTTVFTAVSTAAVPSTSGRLAVRVTLDVDNGASGRTITFSTSPSVGGTYTTLGAAVVQSGVTSVFAGTADLDVGRVNTTNLDEVMQGKVYAFRFRAPIGGTVVASPDFDTLDSNVTTFSDAQARVWTLQGAAVMRNPSARFHGEVSSWPPKWDKRPGGDAWVPIHASGLTRRLSQGQAPLRSVMYRHLTSLDNVVAYWPCEDEDDATELASALPDHPPMVHLSGDIDNASYTGFTSSDPLPLAGEVQWQGDIPTYPVTGQTQVRFLMAVPAAGVTSTSTIIRIYGNGTSPWWKLNVDTSGKLRLQALDPDDVVIEDTLFVAGTNVNGKRLMVSLTFLQVGGAIDYEVETFVVGATTGPDNQFSGTQGGRTMGRVRRVTINMEDSIPESMAQVAIGHIVVQDEITPYIAADESRSVAYSGESATARILRLCHEEGVPVTVVGDVNDSALLGHQRSGRFLELLREAADSDMGILYEPREFLGLAYRTRASLYAQDAALTLNYDDGTLTDIEPVEDDDAVRNDITVTRIGGSTARVRQETGPLSVNPPPAGVGLYDGGAEISLWRDSYLPAQAAWRLHLGTVDEARYPVIAMNLAAEAFASNAGLTAAAVGLDVGDRLVVTNPPSSVPPDDVAQITQGFTEAIGQYEWSIDANCTPASPWDTGVMAGSMLVLDGVSPGRASTPHMAALGIVGDIDIRVHAALDDWSPSAAQALITKSTTTGNQISWRFVVLTTGVLRLVWSVDGSVTLTADSTVAPVVVNGASLWVRATLDVDNGATGRDAKFYTSPDGVLWTQLGTTVTTPGVTSIFNSTAPVVIGSRDVGTLDLMVGSVFAAQVRSGVGGAIVADPDFTVQPGGTTTFTDSAGLVWTVTAPAVVGGPVTDVARYSSDGTTLNAAITAAATSVGVITPTGPLWSGTAVPYDVMVGGERMTVTNVVGAGTAQTMTVVRSVNGVVKGHATGADLQIYPVAYYAL